ncbi:MAG: GIY-YIG nuclease family protein [Alphaproteobacteria bacterium]|nr:GIY-YIG nuclease family protein [Alphaproteobacteria bacterium]MBM3951250.1 GIY-YIG nuclease family protein [Rhodospirillales bacterium]
MSEGYIYILFNRAFQKDHYKIGKTTKTPELRAAEISSATGVPQNFEVLYEEQVVDCEKAERLVHQKLSSFRSSTNREFFVIPLKTAIKVISEVAKEIGKIEKPEEFSYSFDQSMELKDRESDTGELKIIAPGNSNRVKPRISPKSSVTFNDHASYTDEARRQLLYQLRQDIIKLDNRLGEAEICTPGQRIAYKLPGGKVFLEVKVQRSAIILHLIDVSVPDPTSITTTIPESHGWRDLKLRIKITTTAELMQAMPFIEGAYRFQAARI